MKSSDNFATEGLSGKYKQVVFSQRAGETIVGKRPKRKNGTRTAAQQGITSTFKKAVLYAKSILTDAAIKMAYQLKAKRGSSAFNVAIADFFTLPEIGEIDSSGYNGQVGGTLIAEVTDDFKLKSVKVQIEDANGTRIEVGDASLLPDGLNWMYVSTVANPDTTGTKVSFTATDLPGHSISKLKTL